MAGLGSKIAATTVIKDLFQQNSETPFTQDSLMEFFSRVDDSIWEQGVGFVGFVRDQRGIAQFGFRYLNLPTARFGKVGLLGTGAHDAERFFQELNELPEPPQEK